MVIEEAPEYKGLGGGFLGWSSHHKNEARPDFGFAVPVWGPG